MKECVLFSGGMDSYLAWKLFLPKAALVFVDIGQPYLTKELQAAWAVTATERVEFERMTASQVARKPMPSGIVLHRNALLILTAAMQYNFIVLGVLADEINSDKSPEFFRAMEHVLNISHRAQYWNDNIGTAYRIYSPIDGYTKTQLVALYLERGHDVNALLRTVSCYSASHGHCGACPSCFKRWVALTNNGIEQRFRDHPAQWALKNHIPSKATDGTYSKARGAEVMKAMKSCFFT